MRYVAIIIALGLALFGTEGIAGTASDVERFCTNITDAARERRYANKQQELNALSTGIEARLKVLEARRAEYEAWVKKREAFAEQARQSLIQIYARMRPDAAAERLSMLSDGLAAAILMKLKPSLAGTVLNEMTPRRAAAISSVIAASGAGSKS